MSPVKKIVVESVEVSILERPNRDDYFSITDMMKAKDGEFFVTDWLRNRNTLEYLGAWESMNNPIFNYGEFATIRNQAGLNNFKISVKEWVEKTGAIGLSAKAGRYGGTYAHKDIALQFCMWISPVFQLYVIREYQRLKAQEQNPLLGEWNVKRVLSKVNYTIHTDAVKGFIIPQIDEKDQSFAYASEADLLNIALWGCTAAQWRNANPELAEKGLNIRDCGSINELVVISNMESMNAELIKRGNSKRDRYDFLKRMASEQLAHLNAIEADKQFRKLPSGQSDTKLLQ